MTRASGQHTAVRAEKQHDHVSSAFAAASAQKIIWANMPPGREADRRMAQARAAEDSLIALRSESRTALLMKLALLLDWIEPDVTQSALALLQSIMADLEGDAVATQPSATARERNAREGTYFPTPDAQQSQQLDHADPRVVKIHRGARPCTVNGVLYPSVAAAVRALRMTPYQVNQMAA